MVALDKDFPWSWGHFIPRFIWNQILVLGWIWPFMFTAGALFFSDFNGSPLFWRSFTPESPLMHYFGWKIYSSHHFLNLVTEAALVYVMAFYFWRKLGGNFFRYGLV